MKKYLFTTLMLLALIVTGYTQNYNTWERLPLYGSSLFYGDIALTAPDSLIIFNSSSTGYYSTDAALSWTKFDYGFSLIYGVHIHPQFSDSIFVNNYNHLLISGDFGTTWEYKPYKDNQPYGRLSICFANTHYMYSIATTNDRAFASYDKGDTWQIIFEDPNVTLRDISVSPENPLLVFLSTSDSLFKSTDGGQTWTDISNNLLQVTNKTFYKISISPYDDSLIILYEDWYTNSIIISYDQGNTWEKRYVDLGASIGIKSIRYLADNNTIYIAARKSGSDGGIYVSQDRGATWQRLSTNGMMNTDITEVLIDPRNPQVLYALTNGNGVYKTIDGGNNWLPYNQGLYGANIVRVVESPTNPDILIAASRNGGVYRSLNGGKSWGPVNIGLTDLVVKDLIWPEDEPGKILLVTEKKGFFISENNGSSWENRQATDSLYEYQDIVYDSVNKRIYLTGRALVVNRSPVLYSDDWGQTWHRLNVPDGFPTFAYGATYNYLNTSLYVCTMWELYRYDGISWVNLSGTFFENLQEIPEKVTFYPQTIDTLYVITNSGYVYRSTNGGTQFSKISESGYWREVVIDPTNSRHHYLFGYRQMKSFDHGKTWNNMYDKSNLQLTSSLGGDISRYDPEVIYYKTYQGLYRMKQAPEIYKVTLLSTMSVPVGQSQPFEIVFRNDGNSLLTISNFQITGVHASHWSFASQPDKFELTTFQYDTLRMVFQPDSVGDLSVKLTMQTNDPTQPVYQVDLYGNGTGGLLELATNTLDFGNTYVGDSTDLELTLTNVGNAALTINGMDIITTGKNAFYLQGVTTPFTIDIGAQKTVTVRFRPNQTGSFSATLIINSDDVYQSQHNVSLAGKGVAADIDLSGVTEIDFGGVYVGYSVKQNLLVKNTGDANLIIHQVVIPDTAFRLINPTLPIEIAPGQSAQLEFQFTPETLDRYETIMQIYSNDPDTEENPVSVLLKGQGVDRSPAELVLSQNEQNFGEVNIGLTSEPWELTLINNSSVYDLRLDSITINEPAFYFESDVSFPYRLDPGSSITLNVYFKPDTTRNYYGILTIYSNASNSPTQVNLSGVGIFNVGSLSISTTTVNFGQVYLQQRDTITVLLSNTHAMYPVRIDNISVQGNRFYITFLDTSIFPFLLMAQEVYPIPIVFRPTEETSYQGELQIKSNDPNQSLITVSLSGEGIYSRGTIQVSAETINFDTVLVDSVSPPYLVTIANSHQYSSFTIDSIVSNSPAFSFQFSRILPLTMAPQQQETLRVTFHPTQAQTYSGKIFIYSDATNNGFYTIQMQGIGKLPEPPQVTFDPTAISASPGSQMEIQIQLRSDLPIAYARIFYHVGGKTEFDSTDLQPINPQQYGATLPAWLASERGAVYYFKISNGQFVTRYPEQGVFNLPVKMQNLDRNLISDGRYQMVSVPLQLDDPSPLAVLGDNLGEYNEYKWRLFRWINGEYVELSDKDKSIGAFQPGLAFWLATRTATSFNTGSGISTPVADSFVVSLQKGWNQIGNPFAFPVDWSTVKRVGNIANDLWGYNPQSGGYEAATVLQPWEGYFVNALDNQAALVFYPIEAGLQKPASPFEIQDGWAIRIQAGNETAMDRDNYAGMAAVATDGYDPLDWFEPPAIGDFISLYFSHPDWDIPGSFSTDWRSVKENGDVWDFTVSTQSPSRSIQLTFEILGKIPSEFEIWLWDKGTHIPINLQKQPEYSFELRQQENARDFKLIVGTREFVEQVFGEIDILPRELTLYQNFPNPFNPETVIKFALPGDEQVSVIVYNLLGQKVRTLIANQRLSRGYHTVLWKGDNDHNIPQASGIYLLVLKAGNRIKTRKMMLIR
ncbi:MAG: choice-of-anchor D domain-containing protein [Calditrichaeota bacterium]|nr:choice-of-anchor D domain-containing protein [Calditrichota bacterium]